MQGLWRPRFNWHALASTYSTSSATNVSTGHGTSLVAGGTGVLEIVSTAVASNATQNDASQVALYESTIGIPAAGAAPASGDTLIYQTTRTRSTANSNSETTSHIVRTGLVTGTTYYYYHAAAAPGGGTTSLVGGNNQTTIMVRTMPQMG